MLFKNLYLCFTFQFASFSTKFSITDNFRHRSGPPIRDRRSVSGGQVHLPVRRREALGRLAPGPEPEESANSGQHRRDAETEISAAPRHRFGRVGAADDDVGSVLHVLQPSQHAGLRESGLHRASEAAADDDHHPRRRHRVLHLTSVIMTSSVTSSMTSPSSFVTIQSTS